MAGAGQGTTEVGERHRFDEAGLAAFLAREVPGVSGSLVVKRFGYGQSNPTFLLETTSGRRFVLRKKPPGKLIKGAHAVDREFRVLKALGGAGYEVPMVHLLCEDDTVIGTPFYLMDFVKGRIPDNGLQRLSPGQRRPAMLSIVRALARLHCFDLTKLGLLGGEKPFGQVGGFYKRQIATMARTSEAQASNAGGKVPPLHSMRELLHLFAANMPEDRSCLIHGDWKPDNMVLSEDDGPPRVLAVLDWELSTVGHPMSDLANLCLPYHLGKLGALVNYGPYASGAESGMPLEEEVHRAYCEAADVQYPIDGWNFFVAFSEFRLAVIIQGVAMRAALGTASQAAASQVEQMAQVANSVCDGARDLMRSAFGSSKL